MADEQFYLNIAKQILFASDPNEVQTICGNINEVIHHATDHVDNMSNESCITALCSILRQIIRDKIRLEYNEILSIEEGAHEILTHLLRSNYLQ